VPAAWGGGVFVSAADWIAIALLLTLAPFFIVTGVREYRRWRGTGE